MRFVGPVALIAVLALGGCESLPFAKPEAESAKPPPEAAAEPAPPAEPAGTAAEAPEPQPSAAPPPPPRRDAQVRAAIAAYDDGKYTQAVRMLRKALRSKTLDDANRVEAYKYLAFIACSSKQVARCRANFSRALGIDPSFDLTPAEAGHPLWGPVFKSLKQQQKAKR